MGEIIDLPQLESKVGILIERNAAFKTVAEKLSPFIDGLPISKDDNDKLITLILEQVQAAEKGAFQQGFNLGLDLGRRGE